MFNITPTDLTKNKEFHAAFEVTRNITFEVNFYTLGSNRSPNFTTSANELNRPKSDYKQCGQAQEDLLPKGTPARRFFELWDDKHLSDLTIDEYNEMVQDLNKLFEYYNYELQDNTLSNISFYDIVKLSKQPLKAKPQKA